MEHHPKDRVFAMGGVYWCIVDGRVYGAWDCKEYARAGMQVEQRRAAERRATELWAKETHGAGTRR
jgi:hypothetical protein